MPTSPAGRDAACARPVEGRKSLSSAGGDNDQLLNTQGTVGWFDEFTSTDRGLPGQGKGQSLQSVTSMASIMIAIPCWMNIRRDPTFLERCARNGSSAVHESADLWIRHRRRSRALYPVANYYIPPKAAGSGGGTVPKMNSAMPSAPAAGFSPRGRPQPRSGPEGDHLSDRGGEDAIGGYGLNAICSPELCGALEQWRQQVHVPYHGSQYDATGVVHDGSSVPRLVASASRTTTSSSASGQRPTSARATSPGGPERLPPSPELRLNSLPHRSMRRHLSLLIGSGSRPGSSDRTGRQLGLPLLGSTNHDSPREATGGSSAPTAISLRS